MKNDIRPMLTIISVSRLSFTLLYINLALSERSHMTIKYEYMCALSLIP